MSSLCLHSVISFHIVAFQGHLAILAEFCFSQEENCSLELPASGVVFGMRVGLMDGCSVSVG